LFEIGGDQINLLTLRAAALTQDRSRPMWQRLLGVRALGHARPSVARQTMLSLMESRYPAEIQPAAAQAVIAWRDADSAAALFSKWSSYSTSLRRKVISLAVQNSTAAGALLDAVGKDTVASVELDASARTALQRSADAKLKTRAEKLFSQTDNSNRNEILRRYEASLQLRGNSQRGSEIFAKNCVICHTLGGTGANVGPILYGLSSRPSEALLIDIIDPSRQVSPDYISYTVAKADDETLTGLMVSESDSTVTLRRPNLPDEVVPRAQIKEIRADAKSLMPDGLEKDLSIQDMADLLEFLKSPGHKLSVD
jgi:putative heme-binding domain-containing protein